MIQARVWWLGTWSVHEYRGILARKHRAERVRVWKGKTANGNNTKCVNLVGNTQAKNCLMLTCIPSLSGSKSPPRHSCRVPRVGDPLEASNRLLNDPIEFVVLENIFQSSF